MFADKLNSDQANVICLGIVFPQLWLEF